MSKIAIFIHAAILTKTKERLLQYLNILKDSGILEWSPLIFINYVGEGEFSLNNNECLAYSHIINTRVSPNIKEYEVPTQQKLFEFSRDNPTYKVLYIHTKNVGKDINPCIEDQIEYMLYFLITNWRKCITLLDTHKTVGVDLRDEPTLHYSGNFWWANASHIAKLPAPIEYKNLNKYPNPLNSERHNQEFWICSEKQKDKYAVLWDCGINCYERHLHRYEKERYHST
jgi:hypothetical protein